MSDDSELMRGDNVSDDGMSQSNSDYDMGGGDDVGVRDADVNAHEMSSSDSDIDMGRGDNVRVWPVPRPRARPQARPRPNVDI